jgi:thermolabile hemolysin
MFLAIALNAVLTALTTAAPSFSSLYVFGHSWTDTRHGTYWQGRMCNGPVWPEFLSTNFGLAYRASANFAVSGATSSQILNQQVLPLSPPADVASAIFVLGASYENDFLNLDPVTAIANLTNDVFWSTFLGPLVQNNSNSVVALYGKGARTIVVPDMSDFTLLPYVQGLTDLQRSQLRGRCAELNIHLSYALDAIDTSRVDLRLFRLSFNALFNEALSHYRDYGFSTITPSALSDSSLTNNAYDGPGKDYVWWDDVHPTSKMHALWANWIYALVTQTGLETLAMSQDGPVLVIRVAKLNPGQAYTLQTSFDLRNWDDVASFIAPHPTNQWTWPPTNSTPIYFRLNDQ